MHRRAVVWKKTTLTAALHALIGLLAPCADIVTVPLTLHMVDSPGKNCSVVDQDWIRNWIPLLTLRIVSGETFSSKRQTVVSIGGEKKRQRRT